MSSVSEVQCFEEERINPLRDEHVDSQKKTFTKWANSFLEKAQIEIRDLFEDLGDGTILMRLLEIISGDSLGSPKPGTRRVEKVDNINRCLKILQKKVRFENIGAEDIVDGKPHLILGLIWTIILRFEIQEIEIPVDEDDNISEKRSANDALLLWCQRKTDGYSGVKITNFANSWRNGLGFNALIHAHKPGMIAYNKLIPTEHMDNLNNAFYAAKNLGIPSILDAEDIDCEEPDEKSIITYVASYYHCFTKMTSESSDTMTSGDTSLPAELTTFTKQLCNIKVKETKPVALECQLSKPNKTVQWKKSEETVVQNDRITVMVDVHRHQLKIRIAMLEDAGKYSCIYGNASTECTLNVEELSAEFTKILENKTVYENVTAVLECRLSQPNKTVQWVKDGEQICLDERIAVTVAIYTHRLVIQDVKMADAGNFRCLYGNVSTQCTLTVKDLPEQVDLFNKSEFCNWIKTCVSLCFVKEGLIKFSNEKAVDFHNAIKGRVSSRQSNAATTQCHKCTHKQARKAKGKDKNTTTWRINCSMNICSVWLEEILPYHRHQTVCPNIEWKNIDPRLWPSDCWEIVKIFQPYGCEHQHRAEDCDATGLLTLILDCQFFSKFMSNPHVLQEIKDVRNVCMHSKDLLMNHTEMKQSLDLMVTFLRELELQKYQSAIDAEKKIKQLRDGQLYVSMKTLEERVIKEKLAEVEQDITRLENTNKNLSGATGSMSAKQDTYKNEYRKRLEEFIEKLSKATNTLRTLSKENNPTIRKQFIMLINRLQELEQDSREVDEYYQAKVSTLRSEENDVNSEAQELIEKPATRQSVTTESTPWFRKDLQNQIVYEEATVILECQLSKPNLMVTWLKGVTQVSSNDHITMETDNYIHRLIIRDVTLADSGKFWCFCDEVSSCCTLQVDELPPQFITKLENLVVMESVTFTLECQLSKQDQPVQWTKNEQPVVQDDHITVTADTFIHRLIIKDVTLEDAGNFRCICGIENTHCTLKVFGLPETFVKPLENTLSYVMNSTSTTLSCELDRPFRKVTWTKDGQAVCRNSNLKIVSGIYTHQLIFSDLTYSKAGQYTCACGDITTTATLTVQDDDGQCARQLMINGESTKAVRKAVLKKRSSLQQLTLVSVDLASLGDKLSDVIMLSQLVQLTLGDLAGGTKLSHEQCQNLGRDLRQSPKLRELSLRGISCRTHENDKMEGGCIDLDLGGQLRLHDIILDRLPSTQVVFNPEVLLECVIDLNNVISQMSALQNLLGARNLQQFMFYKVSNAAAVSKLVNGLPQMHRLQQLTLWNIDFGSVTDIRLSATMDQLESVDLFHCKFEGAGLEYLLNQHNLPQRRVEIKLREVTIRGEENVINKIRQFPATEVETIGGVIYSEGEWQIWKFVFYTRK